MNPEEKTEIDSLSIAQLLSAQRFAPVGDRRFQGEPGAYRMKRLADLRDQNPDEYVHASKMIGW